MKKFKNGLHVLITAASLLSFLGGWAILAHAPKPVQPLEPLPTLEPVQAFTDQQAAAPRHSRNSGLSPFMTRGS